MEQEPLFFEDIYEVLRHTVHRLGTFKKVGHDMRPELAPDKAGEWLTACLDRNRREKLDFDQFLWLTCEARKIGCHIVLDFISKEAGYATPQPIEPEDEAAELQRQFIESVSAQQRIINRFEKIVKS